MPKGILTALALAIPLGVGCRDESPPPVEPPPVAASKPLRAKDVPPGWDRGEMHKEMPYRWDEGPVHVLVWEIVDLDHDGSVLERCLAIKMYKAPSPNGETCALGYLVRIPKAEKPEWGPKTLWITPDPELKNPPAIWGWECYKAAPTDEDFGKFLGDRGWADEVQPHEAHGLFGGVSQTKVLHPKVMDGGVCPAVWKEVFGRDPNPALFPELSAEQDRKK